MGIKTIWKHLTGGVVYLHSPLKQFTLSATTIEKEYGLNVRELDYSNDEDVDLWCYLVNNSYSDISFSRESARRFISNHPYFEKTQTFVFEQVTGGVIATCSIGLYKDNSNVGGDFKLGVLKEYHNQGLGRIIILYAFSELARKGIKYGESIIEFKRKPSLHLHYSLGFYPEYDFRALAYKSNKVNKLKQYNFILKYLLHRNYRRYLCEQKLNY